MQLESSVTLFDDNKVENRFAELQVTADGITAEVSRKVGNDEVISRINQSAEAVTIQANKINIDGAITAINNNTTTTINGGKITTNTLNGDRIIANTINGDRIIANTVSAGAINANSGTFNTANIPNLNASKITAGTLSADRIGAGSLSVGKIDASSGTFNTANIPNLNASKITAGTLDAARIGTGTLAIGKLDSNAQTTISNATKTATNFITNIDSSGIWVTPSGLKPTNTSTGTGATGTRINGNGMQIYKGGVEVASYSDTTIELGKNSSTSQIKMCGGYGTISVSNATLGIIGNYGGASLSANASYGSSMVYCSGDNVLISATTNGREGANLWVTSNSDEGDVVTADCTQLQLIGRDGYASSLWLTGGTVPPSGSGTTAVWYQSSAGNYGLYRSSSSSRRYKEDIKPVEDDRLDPHRLYDLEVVQFKYKKGYFLPDEPYEQNRINLIGFIAEDVMEHYPQAVLMENNEVENWEIRYIVPPMLKLIQEQNDRITELEQAYRREVDE